MNTLNRLVILTGPMAVLALCLACQTPSAGAAYAHAETSARLTLLGAIPSTLRLTSSIHHSETALIFGPSAYAASDSQRTTFTSPRATELISSGTAEARSVLRGEAVASNYIRSFWTLSNLDIEQPLVVDLSLDWFYRLDMGSDALPVPYESAQTTLGIELSSRENATLPYKRAVRLTGDNERTEQDTYTFSLALPPGETRTLLFGVATATSAYSVPLPAPLALLASSVLGLAAGAMKRRRRVVGQAPSPPARALRHEPVTLLP